MVIRIEGVQGRQFQGQHKRKGKCPLHSNNRTHMKNIKRQTAFGCWYHKYLDKFLPAYALLSMIFCWVFNCCIYSGTQLALGNQYHYDFTTALDRQVPFVKEWILIYVVCYVFWAVNYILVAREGKEHWYRFITAEMLSKIICGLFFIFLPTTNVRPEVVGEDFCSWLVRLIYSVDAPYNLFPSIHCLVSWYCYIGIRKSKKIPVWYQCFSCIFAVLVCASTQFTKQHYLVDIAGGVFIAQVCYTCMKRLNVYQKIESCFEWINRKVFGITE